MKMIPITQYDEQKMQLARPVYDAKGRILLSASHTIHPKLLIRLQQIGIKSLFVEDAESRGITMEEMLDMPTWLDIMEKIKAIFDSVKARKTFQSKDLFDGTGKLVNEVKSRPLVIGIPISTLAEELQSFAHAINVSLLSMQIAKKLQFNDLQLRDLAVGCLLHDIGRLITDDEKKHPEAGFHFIRSIKEVSLLSAHVAYQHHETIDGKGYPRGMKGDAVHLYAQICGLANCYENLISNRNIPPHQVMELMMTKNQIEYSEQVVHAFVNSIPTYPPGTKVKLHTGHEAIVTRIHSHLQRPYIRYLSSGEEISLAENPNLIITGLC